MIYPGSAKTGEKLVNLLQYVNVNLFTSNEPCYLAAAQILNENTAYATNNK